jgi:hypothetical protein
MLNIIPSNRVPLVGIIDPDASAAGTQNTGWISIADFANLMAVIMVGTMATSSTVDAKFQQATDGSGTGVIDVPNKAITQLTQAGTDSDKQAVINLSASEVTETFTHVRLSLITAAAASDSAVAVFGLDARYEPAADLDSVDEIV